MSEITSIINGTLNGAAGVAQGREGTTIQTLAISLASGFVLFVVQFGLFLIVRNYLWAKRIYQPRSFLVPVKQRIKPPHNNPLKWLFTVFKIKEDPDVLEKAGMDAYFFLRYLSMCLKIFFPLAIVVMPILIPLNSEDGRGTRVINNVKGTVTGLDTLAWSNVSPENTSRYWAHLCLAVVAIVWVCLTFYWELKHYIVKRLQYLGSAAHQLRASSTTVLITDIPTDLCTDDALLQMYGDFPGGVRRIWINRDLSKAEATDKERRRIEDMLENAETNMLRKAIKRHRKIAKKDPQVHPARTPTPGEDKPIASDTMCPDTEPVTSAVCARDLEYDITTKATWTEYLEPKHRPTMRIIEKTSPFVARIPFFGIFFRSKVDTIYYCRRELARLNKKLQIELATPEAHPINHTAFIQFNTQKAAHLACQSVANSAPRYMKRRIVEISPADINWASLNIGWKSRYARVVEFLLLFLGLLFAFGLIAFFTGILSRASTLVGSTSWLKWIGSLPSWLISFIQGTLPPFIQVVVLSGPLPILLRSMTNSVKGSYTGQEGERSLQLWYLIFLVFELFIIPTISSGLTSVVEELIHQPTSVPNILATNLPTAANYYFSFLIVQALSLSATSLLQTIRLFNFYIAGSVNTPDSVYNKLSWTNRTRIGSNIPWYTTFAIIGIVYSIIAPLMFAFVLITFSLFWVVIKNNLLYCVRTGNVDGGALWFPSAINQTFTGVYFMEICLIGLFFLVRDTNDNVACDAQGIIMAVVLVFTILYHIWLSVHLGKLFKYAPVQLDLESKSLLNDDESGKSQEDEDTNTSTAEKPNEAGIPLEDFRKGDSSGEDKDDTMPDIVSPPKRPTFKSTQSGQSRGSHMHAKQLQDAKAAKGILARLNRPLDEEYLKQLEKVVGHAEKKVGNVLMPRRKDIEAQMMDDPISKIILQHNDQLETLDAEDRDKLVAAAFAHPLLRDSQLPCVWIPQDDLGISDDEVQRTRAFSADVRIENRGATFNRKLKVVVDQPPPDLDQFDMVITEL
ncbi:uncharacterized protein PV09_08589 [Verruconis gallopava]|uniref:DUF221-domain-containing protein n=1 Tax=Verruconis gallopava TaxID=253628 RepID=A0A0D2AL46_9PEZI|nr:uncharacterized protein PV09_08589 [Verruconis gallopava]KIV99783.1 hypothetical protein PV09_08589 [Verruconis gallopava]